MTPIRVQDTHQTKQSQYSKWKWNNHWARKGGFCPSVCLTRANSLDLEAEH